MTTNASVFRFAKVAVVATLAIAGASFGSGSALAEQAVYSCPNADGTVDLTSEPVNKDQCELLSSAPEPAAANPAAPGSAAATAAVGDAPQVDPRQQYRDLMLQGAQRADGVPAAATNPAVSRRYLKVDRAGFQQQQEQAAAAAPAAAAAAPAGQ